MPSKKQMSDAEFIAYWIAQAVVAKLGDHRNVDMPSQARARLYLMTHASGVFVDPKVHDIDTERLTVLINQWHKKKS